jgi:PhnB protein
VVFLARSPLPTPTFSSAAIGRVGMQMKCRESPGAHRPAASPPAGNASFRMGGTLPMASDHCGLMDKSKGLALSLTQPIEATVKKTFKQLAAGGKVTVPPASTFWSPGFGMLTDKFGFDWMLTVPGA